MAEETSTGAEIKLYSVGTVQNAIKTPIPPPTEPVNDQIAHTEKVRAFRKQVKNNITTLVIDAKFEGLLDGIEGFSHIMVLFWPHLIPSAKRKVTHVHPMGRNDIPKQGVFATCSPARPNPVLVSTVSLLAREGNILRVKGLDAVDGSPIIDIKPFVESYHTAENPVTPRWMQQLHEEFEAGD